MKNKAEFILKVKITSLLCVGVILFSVLMHFFIQHSVDIVKEILRYRVAAVEKSVNIYLSDAESLIYQLAISLAPELAHNNERGVKGLVEGFKSNAKYPLSIPFGVMVLLNEKGSVIADTFSRPDVFSRVKIRGCPVCFSEGNKEAFYANVRPITACIYLRDQIIPIAMSISNASQKTVGVICVGVEVERLNKQLTVHYGKNRYLSHVAVVNKVNAAADANGINVDSVDVTFIIRNFFKREDLVLRQALNKYPFMVEIEVKYKLFEEVAGYILSFFILILGMLIAFTYFSVNIVRDYFQKSLCPLSNKLSALKEHLKEDQGDPYLVVASQSNKLNLNSFIEGVDQLIDDFYFLKITSTKGQELAFKQKIMDLVLTEQHFLRLKSTESVGEDELYLNKLINMIDEKDTELPLVTFLNQISSYCCEFFHEFTIKVIVENNKKNIIFKHSALTETIFHIITFIVRGNCTADNGELIFKGGFVEGSDLPVITIEARIVRSEVIALGWDAGPAYVYTSLLSIFLLAQKNGLFFNIVKKGNKLLFILQPFDKKINFYSQAVV